jgi:hypothetical protein
LTGASDNPGSRSCRIAGYTLFSCLLIMSVAQAEIDGQHVIKGLNVSPKEVARVESGDVLTFSDETYESGKRELSADAMILIETDLDAIARSITEETTLIPGHARIEHGNVKSEADAWY